MILLKKGAVEIQPIRKKLLENERVVKFLQTVGKELTKQNKEHPEERNYKVCLRKFEENEMYEIFTWDADRSIYTRTTEEVKEIDADLIMDITKIGMKIEKSTAGMKGVGVFFNREKSEKFEDFMEEKMKISYFTVILLEVFC